jgi:hypothetical protein
VHNYEHLLSKLQHTTSYEARSIDVKCRTNRRRMLSAGIAAAVIASAAIATGSAQASPHTQKLAPYVLAAGEQLQYGAKGQPPQAFLIDAHGVTNDARGTILDTPPQGSFGTATRAKVTCLTVSGNDAVVTGLQSSRGKGHNHTIVVVEIVNGGSPSKDRLRFSFASSFPPGPRPGCSLPTLGPAGGVTAAGIQIGT